MSTDLEQLLGYKWQRIELLTEAFRHPSWCAEQILRTNSNQRLEFLGDSVIDLIVAEYLMDVMPMADEGRLSQTRSSLVRKEALAERARVLQLGAYLRVGRRDNSIRESQKVLADVMEAVVGAAYQDGGLEAAKVVVQNAGILRRI